MQGTVLHGTRDIRFEDLADPTIVEPTDAIISLSATCICGSDLWPYRGIQAIPQPVPMGHEYCGIVEDVGREVRGIKRGQFVIGSFFASDNTCAALPRRLPDLLRAQAVRGRCAGADIARPARRRHAGSDA